MRNDLNWWRRYQHGQKYVGHKKPVIRASSTLHGETHVEASAFLVTGFLYIQEAINKFFMKSLLILTAIFGIIFISGSVFYYFVIFLPEQESQSQKDIEAIRNVIAPPPPTQKELRAQQDALEKSRVDFNKSLEEWSACQSDILDKQEAEVNAQCPNYMDDPMEWMKCSGSVRKTSQYQSDNCGPMY